MVILNIFNPLNCGLFKQNKSFTFPKQIREGPFYSEMAKPTCLSRMATRNPSLGLTHHTYNRLRAGCYRTIDWDVKELVCSGRAMVPPMAQPNRR